MIWTDVIEEYPDDTYIHPHYEGQGYDGRKYRPVWHAVQGALEQPFDLMVIEE